MSTTRQWLAKGFEAAQSAPGGFLLLGFLWCLVMGLFSGSGGHHGGSVLGAVVVGPSLGALFAVLVHRLRRGELDFGRMKTVGEWLVPALLAGLVMTLFSMVGMVLFVLTVLVLAIPLHLHFPGVVVAAATWSGVTLLVVGSLLVATLYLFAIPLVVDRGLGFWEAMEESRKRVQQHFLRFLGFSLALAGVNLLGLACIGIGVFFTIPITATAIAAAYLELWPEAGQRAEA